MNFRLSVVDCELRIAGCLRFAVYANDWLSPPFAVYASLFNV